MGISHKLDRDGGVDRRPYRRATEAIDMLFESLGPTHLASLAGVERVHEWYQMLREPSKLSVEGLERRTRWIAQGSLSNTRMMAAIQRSVGLIDRLERAEERQAEAVRRDAAAGEIANPPIAPHAKRERHATANVETLRRAS